MDSQPEQLLLDALDRARKMVANVRKQQEELNAVRGTLAPGKREDGARALENAAQAAGGMVDALESALSMTPELPDEELT